MSTTGNGAVVKVWLPCKLCGAKEQLVYLTNLGQACHNCAPMGDVRGAS